MKALIINQEKKAELTASGIVICSAYSIDGILVDHIDISNKVKYPDFPEVEIFNNTERISDLETATTAIIEVLTIKGITP